MSELPHGEVTIADLFRALLAIQTAVGDVSTELKVVTTQMQGQSVTTTAALADHETRLRVVEAARAKLIGAASLAGVLAGTLGGWVASHLH